ncbi:MAG: PAS domain S-box protein [Thermoleophilia bacterium]
MKPKTDPATEKQKSAEISYEAMLAVLDSIDAMVYVADMQSYEVIFLNRYGREMFGDVAGRICWQTFQKDQTGPCSFCTNERLVDSAGRPTGEYKWEFQNTVTGNWYEIRDRAIQWPDGRLVRLEIATDITGKKRVHDDLSQRNKLFEDAQKVAKIGVYILDVPSGLWKSSKMLDEIFGIDDDFTRNVEGWASIIHPDDHQAVVDYFSNEVLAKQSAFDREYRIVRIGDQQERWVYGRGELKLDESGNPVTMLGAIQDITDRKLIEVALQASEARLAEAQHQTRVGHWDWNPQADTLVWSEENWIIMGIPREKPPSVDLFMEYIHPDDREYVGKSIAAALEGAPYDIDFRLNHSDGVEIIIRALGEVEYDGQGKPSRMFGTIQDITESKRAENALKASEERLRKSEALYHDLVETAQDLIWQCDAEGRYIYLNKAWEDVFGYKIDEMLGKKFTDFQTPENAERDMKEFARLMKCNSVKGLETVHKSKNGREIHLVFNAKVMFDEEGKPAGTRGTAYDITDTRNLEQQLLQSQKIESLGRLAGGVAHDFNNILTAVQGYTELAMADLPRSSTAYLELQEAQKSTARAVDLTRQLLLSSRKGPLQQKPVNLTNIVMNMKRLLDKIIGERYVIKLQLEENLRNSTGDESNLEQALMNLVMNARDSMPKGGEIIVVTNNCHISEEVAKSNLEARPGDFVSLSVMDSGSGIDDATRASIFDPFFSTKEVGKGSGLGLSVVHGVVKQHGGWIEVESEPGEGSVFTLRLPVSESVEAIDVQVSGESASEPAPGRKVLLVEDEEMVRELTEKILVRNGYQVQTAVDADEARAVFKEAGGDFDLIFSDVVLPGEDGFSLCRDLQKQKPSLGIIMASGYSETYVNPDEIKQKGYLFLHKPYNLDVLLGAIGEALRTSLQRQGNLP